MIGHGFPRIIEAIPRIIPWGILLKSLNKTIFSWPINSWPHSNENERGIFTLREHDLLRVRIGVRNRPRINRHNCPNILIYNDYFELIIRGIIRGKYRGSTWNSVECGKKRDQRAQTETGCE